MLQDAAKFQFDRFVLCLCSLLLVPSRVAGGIMFPNGPFVPLVCPIRPNLL